MKYAVILGDGMADWKIPALGDKTCLEAAKTPALDKFAPYAEIGLCKTVPDGYKPGSDVANMSVLGFAPARYYTGRSPLEAVSMGIKLGADDVTLRCNLVTLSEDEPYDLKTMIDYSAGDISTEEARELMRDVQQAFGSEKFEFYCGMAYRHCLVAKGGVFGHELTPPHDITDKKITDSLPKGPNAKIYDEFMRKSYEILSAHPVNLKRKSEGKRPANSIWLWGEGTKPALENFERLRGLKGGIISAVDLVRGIAMLADLKIIEVENITANYETNFSGKAQAAANALLNDGLDFVYLHVEAADECGHHGDYAHKVYSIEKIDGIISELTDRLKTANEDFAILVCPDHPTPCAIKTHTSDPVPYLLYASANSATLKIAGAKRLTEDEAAKSGVYVGEGHKLIEKLFAIK